MAKILRRKVKFVSHDPWTRLYAPGDKVVILLSKMDDEGPAVVVEGEGKCAQIVSTKSVRYLNNKEVKL